MDQKKWLGFLFVSAVASVFLVGFPRSLHADETLGPLPAPLDFVDSSRDFFWYESGSSVDGPPVKGHEVHVASGKALSSAQTEDTGGKSNIAFINGCFDGGCVMSAGGNDSRSNSSDIVRRDITMPEFPHGEVVWNSVMDCVRDTYRDFNVFITDTDPGESVSHYEAIVSGTPDLVGQDEFVGGIAPFNCGPIPNSVAFAFAEFSGPNVPELCSTIAHELGHTFGLDHEYLCEDPMSYLTDCPAEKRFEDQNVECGRFQVEPCVCGEATQNSYQKLLGDVGPSEPTPPKVEIVYPKKNAKVENGFTVELEASDDMEIDIVELYMDHKRVRQMFSPPFTWTAPSDRSDGRVTLVAKAYDNFGFSSETTIKFSQGEACRDPEDCAESETCLDGRCVAAPGIDGGLGEGCESDAQCESTACYEGEEGDVCIEICELGKQGCPEDFGCMKMVDERGACILGYDDAQGGCAVSGGTPAGLALIAFVAFLGLLRRWGTVA